MTQPSWSKACGLGQDSIGHRRRFGPLPGHSLLYASAGARVFLAGRWRAPVIKVCANADTYCRRKDDMNVDACRFSPPARLTSVDWASGATTVTASQKLCSSLCLHSP